MSEKNKVYVGRLAWRATDDDLYDVFEKYGSVSEVSIIRERDTGKSKGFAFVTFNSSRDADDAIHGANGAEICGRPIEVDSAKPKPTGGGGGYSDRDRGDRRSGGGSRVGGYGGGGRSYGGGSYGGSRDYSGGGGRRGSGYGSGGRSYDRDRSSRY